MTGSESYRLTPIGQLTSDYPDKFGVPRQPGLVEQARGIISLLDPYDDPLAFQGINEYSHIWLTFIFDRSPDSWRPRVRPPRFGGNKRVGVFATRSTHRPNRLGLSLVRLLDVASTPRPKPPPWRLPGHDATMKARTHLLIGEHDLVSRTPIIDIKPYLPWADAKPKARAGFAADMPAQFSVNWTDAAAATVAARADHDSMRPLIQQTLAQDPRPAYHRNTSRREYALSLRDANICFTVDDMRREITVTKVTNSPPPNV